MAYYVMDGEGVHPVAAIAATRNRQSFKKRRWLDGNELGFEITERVIYDLDPLRPGTPKELYQSQPIPAMSDRLVDALHAVGVDNLELFDAVLVDPANGKEYSNYKAFNIVGKVRAADMSASTRMGVSEDEIIAVDFDSLVLDESKCRGLLLFRLAENLSAIVVEERVKREVEKRGIPGMFFYQSGEWSG
jgi:hypothetical protein